MSAGVAVRGGLERRAEERARELLGGRDLVVDEISCRRVDGGFYCEGTCTNRRTGESGPCGVWVREDELG